EVREGAGVVALTLTNREPDQLHPVREIGGQQVVRNTRYSCSGGAAACIVFHLRNGFSRPASKGNVTSPSAGRLSLGGAVPEHGVDLGAGHEDAPANLHGSDVPAPDQLVERGPAHAEGAGRLLDPEGTANAGAAVEALTEGLDPVVHGGEAGLDGIEALGEFGGIE